jgi:ATP adenylyltransferase
VVSACRACDVGAGNRPIPGGLIHETAHWRVEHSLGSLGTGALFVTAKRHVVHLADLDPVESAEIGPLLVEASRVVTETTDALQVYVNLWSHNGSEPVHIHWVVHPLTRELLDRYGRTGPRLQAAMFDGHGSPAAVEIERAADAARAAFASGEGLRS